VIRKCARSALAGPLLVAALSGCATFATLSENETNNKVFSGTIRHFELKCGHAVCLDFPFSLVADAVLLPVTIPYTIVNLMRSDDKKSDRPAKTEGEEKRQ
jgi:uncharacterized protein YceK